MAVNAARVKRIKKYLWRLSIRGDSGRSWWLMWVNAGGACMWMWDRQRHKIKLV